MQVDAFGPATSLFRLDVVSVSMAIPKPTSPLEIGAVSVGAVFALLVVMPLLPLLLDFAVGLFRGVFDVIVPKREKITPGT